MSSLGVKWEDVSSEAYHLNLGKKLFLVLTQGPTKSNHYSRRQLDAFFAAATEI